MTEIEKLQKIVRWYADATPEETKQLAPQENIQQISEIESFLDASLPKSIRALFEKFNGEKGDGYGTFLGHSFVSLEEVKTNLEFAKTLIKPTTPRINKPERADKLIGRIIEFVVNELPLKKKLGFIKTKWHKVEFETGPSSMGGPYFYKNENTSAKERTVVRLSNETQKEISKLTNELHKLEIEHYNWDELEITAYGDGHHNVNRTFYDFDNTLPLTSTPSGAIKKKYFHIKWIPILSDFGGNYIGIDLDPDTNGTKGQVIIFGRDEEDMFVLANSWDEFLDWNLDLIQNSGEKLKKEQHLHGIYKELKIAELKA